MFSEDHEKFIEVHKKDPKTLAALIVEEYQTQLEKDKKYNTFTHSSSCGFFGGGTYSHEILKALRDFSQGTEVDFYFLHEKKPGHRLKVILANHAFLTPEGGFNATCFVEAMQLVNKDKQKGA